MKKKKDINKKHRDRLKLAKRYMKNDVGYFGLWSGYKNYHYLSAAWDVYFSSTKKRSYRYGTENEIHAKIGTLTREEIYMLQEKIYTDTLHSAIKLLPKSATIYSASGRYSVVRKELCQARRLANKRACYLYEKGLDDKADISVGEFQREQLMWEVF